MCYVEFHYFSLSRVHHLVVILIFLKHAVGHDGQYTKYMCGFFSLNYCMLYSLCLCSLGWISQNPQPQENWPVHKRFSPGGIQSSVLEAPVME